MDYIQDTISRVKLRILWYIILSFFIFINIQNNLGIIMSLLCLIMAWNDYSVLRQ